MVSPEEAGEGDKKTQGEVTGQGRLRSPKLVQSAEGGKGKDKRERIIVVVRSPCRENYPADARTSQCWSRQTQHGLGVCIWMPGQRHRQQPVSGTADQGVIKQDKSSRGSVDTTKTPSDPQRVRMCKGERPIGAAKGKQTNTMASCQTPPQSAAPHTRCAARVPGTSAGVGLLPVHVAPLPPLHLRVVRPPPGRHPLGPELHLRPHHLLLLGPAVLDPNARVDVRVARRVPRARRGQVAVRPPDASQQPALRPALRAGPAGAAPAQLQPPAGQVVSRCALCHWTERRGRLVQARWTLVRAVLQKTRAFVVFTKTSPGIRTALSAPLEGAHVFSLQVTVFKQMHRWML